MHCAKTPDSKSAALILRKISIGKLKMHVNKISGYILCHMVVKVGLTKINRVGDQWGHPYCLLVTEMGTPMFLFTFINQEE